MKNKIKIIYEDNHLLVCEKPVNMPVQADSSGDEDLLSTVKAYIKEKYSKPGEVYLGLVHRLEPTRRRRNGFCANKQSSCAPYRKL